MQQSKRPDHHRVLSIPDCVLFWLRQLKFSPPSTVIAIPFIPFSPLLWIVGFESCDDNLFAATPMQINLWGSPMSVAIFSFIHSHRGRQGVLRRGDGGATMCNGGPGPGKSISEKNLEDAETVGFGNKGFALFPSRAGVAITTRVMVSPLKSNGIGSAAIFSFQVVHYILFGQVRRPTHFHQTQPSQWVYPTTPPLPKQALWGQEPARLGRHRLRAPQSLPGDQ